MRFWSFILIALSCNFGIGQNLVPNPSFELIDSCPNYNENTLVLASFWSGPSYNSSDLFHPCFANASQVPPNTWGNNYQEGKSGIAYCGLVAFNNIHEYAQVKLIDTLAAGACYIVEFFINRSYIGAYASNNLGCIFSSSMIDTNSALSVIEQNPDILKFDNPIIYDTTNWVPVKGIYSAIGTEVYFLLGNFSLDVNSSAEYVGGPTSAAYYLIDDVSVIPTDSLPGGMPAFAGNDTTIFYGDTLFIGQELYGLNCNWYDQFSNQIATNISGIDVWPDSSTYYVVEQILCSNTTYDTIWVTVDTSNIGINNWQQELAVNLYPNPSSGQVYVEVASEINALNIRVLDLNGREVFSTNLYSENGVFVVQPELSRGVYLIKITEPESGTVTTKRLVMQ